MSSGSERNECRVADDVWQMQHNQDHHEDTPRDHPTVSSFVLARYEARRATRWQKWAVKQRSARKDGHKSIFTRGGCIKMSDTLSSSLDNWNRLLAMEKLGPFTSSDTRESPTASDTWSSLRSLEKINVSHFMGHLKFFRLLRSADGRFAVYERIWSLLLVKNGLQSHLVHTHCTKQNEFRDSAVDKAAYGRDSPVSPNISVLISVSCEKTVSILINSDIHMLHKNLSTNF
jgi:hypothetical protein